MNNTLRTLSGAAAAAIVALVLLIYNLAPLALGLPGLIERVPDDAFYYLVLGKNFVAHRFWTFDGTAVASGFHILFGYLIAALYWVWPGIGLQAAYGLVVVFNVALVSAAVYLLARVNDLLDISTGNIGLILVALSAAGLRLPGFPMEACLVIFFSAAAFYMVAMPGEGPRGAALPLLVGVLGVLSRSDWGALPFALLAGVLLHAWYRGHLDRAAWRAALWMCAGGVIGELLVMMHTYAFTGGIVQKSASIKNFWASVQGYSPLPGVARVLELFAPALVPRGLTLIVVTVIAVMVVWKGRINALVSHPVLAASMLIIAGYVAVYAFNGSVQYWYAASFFAACAVLSSALWARLPEGLGWVRAAALSLYALLGAYQFATPPWTWAPAMMEAGRHLKQNPQLAPVAAWNAGIISYFAGRPVVNLDGLVNDDVYPFVISGRLGDYIMERDIAYLLDFPDIFSPMGGLKGGYGDGRLAACVAPVRTFRPERTFADTAMTLYRVDKVCLATPAGAERAKR